MYFAIFRAGVTSERCVLDARLRTHRLFKHKLKDVILGACDIWYTILVIVSRGLLAE